MGVGSRGPDRARAHPVIWCHHRKADVLFHLFEAGGMIDNNILILKKILYINLLWEKVTFITTAHLCQKGNTGQPVSSVG